MDTPANLVFIWPWAVVILPLPWLVAWWLKSQTSIFSYNNSSITKGALKLPHLDSALTAIFYGDRDFLKEYPNLLNTPIYIKFDSNFLQFNNYEYYGFVRDYII